ncbi:beta strand repeat-containing protein, partial [Clostridium botulinum]|uniref:beta strand repeat-containing protein n=3 Tax=Clostridium botulinum TaxID=1491 RepID=UPI001E454F20
MTLYPEYETTITGGMTFTGNTIGLSKQADSYYAGTSNSIGAYTTVDTSTNVTNYPQGTITFIDNNSSKAVLNIPEGSIIQSAYLIWGGSSIVRYGMSGSQDYQSLVGNPVDFEFPTSDSNSSSITYETQKISPGGKQRYPIFGATSSQPYTLYTNWANVTSYIKYPGTFKVSRVVGTIAQYENSLNCCGWLLAVLYKNSFLPARHFSLSIGVDFVNVGTPIDISKTNFTTPIYNSPKGRLLLAALNGDATITGDQVLLGPNITNLTPLSGPQNLVNNFFGSQINDDTGNTDTSGTFGDRNQDIHTATNMIAGRQGIDITNVDASPGLSNNQTSANVRFNTTNDTYFISAVGTQIDISAPVFDTSTITADKKYVKVGNSVNFTIKIINTGDILAQYVTLKDILPPEFSFVANSLKIDGISYPQDVTQVVPLKELNHNQSTTLDFSATVDAPVTGGGYTFINRANLNYSFKISSGYLVKDFEITPNVMYNESIALIPLFSKEAVTNNSIQRVAAIGDTIDYTINIVNINSSSHNSNTMINTILKDILPSGLTYKPGSLYIDNVPSSDNLSSINIGTIHYNTLKSIKFTAEVTGTPASDSKYVNSADINYEFTLNDGTILSNSMSTNNDIYSDSIVIIPNVSKTSTSSNANHNIAAIGDTIDYTITVTNPSTSSTIQNVILNDTLPTGLTYKIGSLSINNVPSSDSLTSINVGNIDANSTTTVKFTANVTATPSSDFKYVNSTVVNYEFLAPDGTALSNNVTANNTIYSDSVLITPNISKTSISSNTVSNTAGIGDTIDYTVTINNPSASSSLQNATLNDTLPIGLTYKTGSLSINGSSSSNSLTSINIGNINPSSTITINFTATVAGNPASDSKYVNLATLNYEFSTPDSNTLNNSISTNNTVYSSSVIITPTMTKTAVSSNSGPSTATIGDTIEYTIIINNPSATNSIINAVLNDTLPSEIVYKTGSLSINGTSSSDNISSMNIGTINPDSTTTIKFTANVTGNPASDSKYVNSANLNYGFLTPDGTTLNNSVSATNTVYSSSVIITPTMTKTAISSNTVPNIVAIGDTIDYTITITNTNDTASIINAVLNDILPTGLNYKNGSLTINNIPSSDNLASINIDTINPNSTTTIKFIADVTTSPASNFKYVNSVNLQYKYLAPDGTTLQNTISTDSTIYSNSVIITPTMTKTAVSSNIVPDTVSIGGTIDYTITIHNNSSSTIRNSILNDTFPIGLTYKTGSLSINGTSSSDSLTSINIGNINPSSTITIKFTANVTGNPASDSKYVNLATLNYEFLAPDGNSLNNSIIATKNVYSSSIVINPTITKTDNSSNAIPHVVSIGDTVTYTITIHNSSTTKSITNINLTDTLPSGLTFKAGSVTVNSIPQTSANPTIGISIPIINTNSDATVSFVVDVTAAPSTGDIKYVNTATAQYNFESPDSTTLTSSVTTNNTIYYDSIVITPNVIKTANTNVASVGNIIT